MACQPKLATRPPSPRLRWATFADISERRMVGLTRFELVTPRLSSVCSNQLSYRPLMVKRRNRRFVLKPVLHVTRTYQRTPLRDATDLTRSAAKREVRFSQN